MSKIVDGKTLFTYREYVHFPDDGKRHEIIAGDHYVTPSPVTRHQRISRHLQFQLYQAIEIPGHGEVFDAPMDLLLSEIDIVQPDIFVVLSANRRIVKPQNVNGTPDLVVEITSPSTRKRDLELKRELYQRTGVAEYWVVLTDDDHVEQYLLEGHQYRLDGRVDESIRFRGLEGVTVDLTKIW
jgi:Uma2 family endonuclease